METFKNTVTNILYAISPNAGARIGIVQNDIKQTADLLTKESDYFQAIFDLFVAIGIGLAIMYFIIELMNIASTTELTMEKVVKSFIKLCIAVFLVKIGYEVLIQIANIGSTLSEAIELTPEVEESNIDFAITSIWNFLIVFFGLIPMALTYIIVFICSKIILYSRLVEISVNLCLSPIALADIPTGGLRSNGVTFLRKFLGLSLQSVVIVLIMAVFYELSSTVGLSAGLGSILEGVATGAGGATLAATLNGGIQTVYTFFIGLFGGGTAVSFLVGAYFICAIFLTVVYITEAVIMLSFMFKSKQIAMDIVGMG